MKAVRVHTYGSPDVLKCVDIPVPEPGAGEAVIRIAAIGLNFIDVYYRRGWYKASATPFTPGMEAAGVVEAVGPGVTEVRVGDRVAWVMTIGAYAEYAAVPSWKLVKLPDSIDFRTAASVMLQGLTAHFLSHSCFPLNPGHEALVHAAAGGVGLLLTQMCRKRGATVYATVGSESKVVAAQRAGANATIVYSKQEFDQEVERLTDGRGVDVVYDSVGLATFEKSLNCLRPRGCMVIFGFSSGAIPPFDVARLHDKALFLTRASLRRYTATREELVARANDLFEWIAARALTIHVDSAFPLADAVQAHKLLESRRTTGKILLLP